MKDEIFYRMHNEYVANGYIQIMLGHRGKMLLFGNNGLMYSDKSDKNKVNVYLKDERKKQFPYNDIPSHKERVSPFLKLNFTNQILDIGKPYIKINDNLISKITVCKDDKGAIVHTKILNGKINNYSKIILNREELENYLLTGTIGDDKYNNCYIFDMNCNLYDKNLSDETYWLDREKSKLREIVLNSNEYDERTVLQMISAIDNMEKMEPFYCITKKNMIKFKKNCDIKLEGFAVKYLDHDKYELSTLSLPITRENLSMIKEKINLSKIKTTKLPKVKKLHIK